MTGSDSLGGCVGHWASVCPRLSLSDFWLCYKRLDNMAGDANLVLVVNENWVSVNDLAGEAGLFT